MSSFTGGTSGTGNTGNFTFGTGTATGGGISGGAALTTGNSTLSGTGGMSAKTGNAGTNSGQWNLETGTGVLTSGPIFIQPGTASSAGQLRLIGGTSTGSTGGLLNLVGGASTVGNGGGVDISTGAGATNFNSGNYTFRTENALGTGGSGTVQISTGSVVSGARGYISLSSAGVILITEATKPTCDSSIRGMLWYTQSGAGVADIFEICSKNAADAYVWTTH